MYSTCIHLDVHVYVHMHICIHIHVRVHAEGHVDVDVSVHMIYVDHLFLYLDTIKEMNMYKCIHM